MTLELYHAPQSTCSQGVAPDVRSQQQEARQ